MMKKVAIVLVVVLLCSEEYTSVCLGGYVYGRVMLTEAQVRPPGRSRNPANRPKPKVQKCGNKYCAPHERCERQLVPVPTCY